MTRPGAADLRLSALAPAKLNLGLWILRRRPDGYHDILTIFQAIDLYDRLEASTRPRGLSLDCRAPGVPRGGGNLVLQAARLLQREAGISRGAALRLEKRIPPGSGLGGGSSDAAAALLLLDRLWGLGLGVARLHKLAARLGSDVPFFLRGGTALGRGRGGRLIPLRLSQPLDFLVLHGSRPIATKWAYSQYKRELTASGPPPKIAALVSGARLTIEAIKGLDNQLEPGLEVHYPDILERKSRLLGWGALSAGLTGSGSSVYGVFPSRGGASRAAARFARAGYPAVVCRSVADGVVFGEQDRRGTRAPGIARSLA